MAIVPGMRLGHYEMVAPLGAGGMGEVYRAPDTTLGRDVALKILPPAYAQDTDRLARLEREAKLLASVSHPGLATLYGLEEIDGQRVLVMERVEGEDLAQRLGAGRGYRSGRRSRWRARWPRRSRRPTIGGSCTATSSPPT